MAVSSDNVEHDYAEQQDKGRHRTPPPHRACLRATGAVRHKDDFRKPFVAVANSFNQVIPGHAHLDKVGAKIREAVSRLAAMPFEFNVIGVDDGIAMGHGGMKFSLPSRELIADCIETMVKAHCFDGHGLHPKLRQDRPGHADGGRHGATSRPSSCSGGPMKAGTDPRRSDG